MNCADLLLQVECYVGLRRALGYTIRSEEKLLNDFVLSLESRNVHAPIRRRWRWTGPVQQRQAVGQPARPAA